MKAAQWSRRIACILAALYLAAGAVPAFGQTLSVDGHAYLESGSAHDGIAAIFTAVSPTASTDSATTDVNGYYSINLNPGVYHIEFRKPGYRSLVYASEILISSNITLNDVTLAEGAFKTIAGNVSGLWARETTYIVVSDVTVLAQDTLTIESGVTVLFDDNYYIKIYGLLIAQGASDDSITFTSGQPNKARGDWGGLRFYNSADDNSILDYCIIEYGGGSVSGALVSIFDASPTIQNSSLRESFHNGVWGSNAAPNIFDNTIVNNSGYGLVFGGTSDLIVSGIPLIRNNEIGQNGRAGIHADSPLTIIVENNNIFDNGGIGIEMFNGTKIFQFIQ